LSKVLETRFHVAFMWAQKGPNARCTHTTYPPASGIIAPSSAVMSAIGSDQIHGSSRMPRRAMAGPAAPTASSTP